MKFIFFFYLCLLLTTAQARAATWKVPVLFWSMKIEGQVAMRKGFEEEIAKFNSSGKDEIHIQAFVAGEGRKGVLNQISQLERTLQSNPPALVIQPTDNSALALGLQEANRKKIPVITYDQYIVNGSILSYVTSDNYQAGWDNGIYINSLFDAKKNLRIVVFEYPRVSSTTERVDGFFDALRKQDRRFTVLKTYEAVDPTSGAIAVKNFLKDFPAKGSVDLILTVNDGGGITIVKQLVAKSRTEIVHATFDGDPASVQNIQEKKLTVIDSAQFCAELGRETARSLIAHLKKMPTESKKLIPTFPVTSKSLAQYPGWMGVPTTQRKTEPAPKRRLAPLRRSETERLIIKIGVPPLCPYLCEQGPGKWGGYLFDILQDIANKNNFTLQIESIVQSRQIPSLQMHRVNYIIVPADMVRYLSQIRLVGPSLGVMFVGALVPQENKETLIDEEYISKKRLVLSGVAGDGTEGIFDHVNTPRVTKLTGADAPDRMVKMIYDRRVDLALGDYNVLSYSLLKKAEANLQLLPTSLTGFNSIVLVSKPKDSDYGGLPQYLNDWFIDARKSGQLEKILNRYNLKDWQLFLRD
ncbi:substrate-binding domain-containing protein [Bdellovibrio sp. HCB2-146]|uniref:substrate-binding domain-containing protein n=1 Tax=Bdellovibrio sp. HCB2-146 TaxID=3394362 RepID=UPI0039BC5FBD